jgi:Alpha-L-arabinofuranosidase B, catalytic
MYESVRYHRQIETQVMVPAPQPMLLDFITTAATAAYSTRKLRVNYAGSCLRVRRSSDNTETDIGFSGNGLLDTSSLLSFVGGNDGLVTKWYNQSTSVTNLDMAMATAAFQPQIVASGTLQKINNNPALKLIAANAYHFDAPGGTLLSNFVSASAYTLLTGFNAASYSTGGVETPVIFEDRGGNCGFGPLNVGGHVNSFTGYHFSTTDELWSIGISLSTNYVAISKFGGGTLSGYINGGAGTSAAAGNIGSVSGAPPSIGEAFDSVSDYDGKLTELITFNTALSTSNLNILGNGSGIGGGGNMSTYSGVTWSVIP